MTARVTERSPFVLGRRWALDRPYHLLGSGRFARTFAGHDLETGAPVAIKLLNEDVPHDVRDRFLREAAVHAQLDHSAIIELLGHGRDGDRHYIVTPRMRGSVGDLVLEQPGRRLSPSMALGIARRMIDALDYLYEQRHTHGDISPGNILIDVRHEAYLADFGFSKVVDAAPHATAGDHFGTEGFRAPRDIGERRTYDDDLFSLAAVLWFCLAGRSPLHAGPAHLPRALRRPLERALNWEDMPSLAEFRAEIEQRWSKVGSDWREETGTPPRWRRPAFAAGALAGLLAAIAAGQALEAEPPERPHAVLRSSAVALRLEGDWQQRTPPAIRGIALRSALSATDLDTQVAVGLTRPRGAGLIGRSARLTLPIVARSPRRTVIDGRPALRYGPYRNRAGGRTEVLALPLERNALVVWCEGTGPSLRTKCARAAAGADPLRESARALAPRRSAAVALRNATAALSERRRGARARMAARHEAARMRSDARDLATAHRLFAGDVEAIPPSAHDAAALDALVAAARRSATAYAALAAATDDGAWRAARRRAVEAERALDATLRALSNLGYVPRR